MFGRKTFDQDLPERPRSSSAPAAVKSKVVPIIAAAKLDAQPEANRNNFAVQPLIFRRLGREHQYRQQHTIAITQIMGTQ